MPPATVITSGEPYLVMEWLEGETLADRLNGAGLPIEERIESRREGRRGRMRSRLGGWPTRKDCYVAAAGQDISFARLLVGATFRHLMQFRGVGPCCAALVCSFLLLTGCKSNAERFRAGMDKIAEEHRAALDKKKREFAAVQEAAKARPALAPIALPTPPLSGREGFNVVALSETVPLDRKLALSEPDTCAPVYQQGASFALASGFRPTWGPGESFAPDEAEFKRHEEKVESLLAVPYALVCRTLSVTQPVMVNPKEFTGGDYTGECRLYEIATARYLGGFAINVRLTSSNRHVESGLAQEITKAVFVELAPVGGAGVSFGCSWKK